MLGPRALREVEEAAADILKNHRDGARIRAICKGLLGTTPRVADIANDGALAKIRGVSWVFVRRGMSRERQEWVAAHETSHHYWEDVVGYQGQDLEARCDALGAALVAPSARVTSANDKFNGDVVAIADALRATQSVALLRLGEVLGEPVALLRRRRSTIIRGKFVSWPVPLSWQPAKMSDELVRVRITDESGRFGVKRWKPKKD